MRTILTKQIDGYQVVKGIGYPALDPVSTRKAVKPLLESCQEFKNHFKRAEKCDQTLKTAWEKAQITRRKLFNQKFNQKYNLKKTSEYKIYQDLSDKLNQTEAAERTTKKIQEVSAAWRQVMEKEMELRKQVNVNQAFFKTKEYKTFLGLRDSERESVRESAATLAQKRLELTRDNAVYFTPRAGEVIISDAEGTDCVTQLSALSVATVLSRDPDTTVLTVISDLRGTEYWNIQNNRWQKNKITVLNEDIPTGGILTIDLTADNRTEIVEEAEEDRVAALSTAEKQSEYDAAVLSLTAEMVNYRSGLEIGGTESADALTQTQDLFETEDEKLKAKYGIE